MNRSPDDDVDQSEREGDVDDVLVLLYRGSDGTKRRLVTRHSGCGAGSCGRPPPPQAESSLRVAAPASALSQSQCAQVWPRKSGALIWPASPTYRSLQGYTRVLLKAGETMPVSFTLTPAQYSTTLANGTMSVLSGEYKIAVSGHQPDDAAGLAASNVATGSFAV